jgi:hypothetical protein
MHVGVEGEDRDGDKHMKEKENQKGRLTKTQTKRQQN